MTEPLRFAIVGSGMIAQVHARALAELSDRARRIIAAERESGRRVAVISQHRFDRSAQRVFAAIRSGGLGTVTSVIASCAWWRGQSYYDSAAWRGT